jgi:hypothetical protein
LRTSTKLKKILEYNTATISLSNGVFDIIITNNQSGSSHISSGINFSQAIERAYRDTIKAAGNKEFNF